MKIIFYALISFLLVGNLSAQTDAQATVKSAGLVASGYIKAASPVTFPNSQNNVQVIMSFSLPANGETNPANAPAIVSKTSPLGLAVSNYPIAIANDRFVYTCYVEGNLTGGPLPTWATNSENLVMQITFASSASGKFPRLDNLLNSGPNGADYFYFIVNGNQRSDTEGDPFYDGTEGFYASGDAYVQAPSPLPITLIAFNAQKFQDRSTHLTWSTSSEVNGSHFNIQRSFDNKTWSNVGSVNAVGNSQIIQNYEFMDANVYNGRDSRLTAYYRLQAVDLDGTSKNSLIKSVVFTSTGSDVGREISVYPNPSSEGVYITWDNSGEQPANLEFFDIHGKLAYTRKVADNSTQEYIDFSKTTIIPGLYIVRILGKTEVIDTKQIIVEKR